MWFVLAAVLVAVPGTPVRVEDALKLERSGRDSDALVLLDRMVREQPTNFLPRLEAARLRLKMGQELERAQLDSDVARALAPENARAQYVWGLVSEELRRDGDAALAYRNALEIRPAYEDARRRLAGLLAATGEWSKAEVEYRHLLELKPEDVQVRLQLVKTLEEQGRLPAAEEELVRMWARDRTSRLVGRRLAELYERTDRPELARKIREVLDPPAREKKMRPLKKSRR